MENLTQQPYTDTPVDLRHTSSPSSSNSSNATIKPLPALPLSQTTEEPYRDEPATPVLHSRYHRSRASPSIQQHQIQIPYRPYTDLPSPSEAPSPTNDDDVPLAHLIVSPQQQAPLYTYPHPQQQSPPYACSQPHPQPQLQAPPYPYPNPPSYPLDAPPSYSIAVRQSRRSTLIQLIPSQQQRPSSTLLIDVDEESGLGVDGEAADDVRHAVEKVVAMFVVAALLLVIAGVLGWLALGSGIWD